MFDKLFKRKPALDWSTWSENELRSYLHKGGDPNLKDADGGTPLIQAAAIGALSLVEELLDKDADVNARTNNGTPVVMYVIANSSQNKTKILWALLQKHVDVNIQEKDGYTPLMYAIISRQTEIAKLLIAHHADVNLKDNKGRTALDCAETMDNFEVAQAIRDEM